MNILKKTIFLFISAINIFSLSTAPALAWGDAGIARPNVTEGMDLIIEDLGINKGELKTAIQSLNVSRLKKQQPQVTITFEPTTPTPGEKVTAVATPLYFVNDSKKLYFTWYLNKKDGQSDPEGWREDAAKIIANNGFDWDPDGNGEADGEPYDSDNDDDGYRATIGGEDQQGKNNRCYIHDTQSGEEYEMDGCGHVFPDGIGNGSFGLSEEKKYHTDPHDPDTGDFGYGDEAAIAGLGMEKFSWTYEEGDEIGVIVEGVSVEPTNYQDSSFKTMWALPKNACEIKGIYTEGEEGEETLKTSMDSDDINDCMRDNMIDPAEGGGRKEKLEVTLSHNPEFPINDPNPNTDEGDELIVHSSVINPLNQGYLKYTWQVYQSNERNPESWGTPIPKSELGSTTQTIGMGLDSFRFKLKFDSPKRYLRVKLTVTENVSIGLTREGWAETIFPVFSTEERIRVFDASVSSSLVPSILSSTERCREGIDRAICPITKNQIVGLRGPGSNLTDFLWTVNGRPVAPLTEDCSLGECNETNGSSLTNTAFFPVLEETGAIYEVTMSATNQDSGQKITLSKTFQVNDPEVFIASGDDAVCTAALLGNYIDLDGKQWPEYSQDAFLGLSETELKLKPVFLGFNPEIPSYAWNVDGIEVTRDNATSFGFSIDDNNILTLTPKERGQVYNVGLTALYVQDLNTRKALAKYWGVALNDFFESNVSKSVDITMVDSLNGSVSAKAQTPQEKILASAYTNAPQYFLFLLRIVLTGFLMLVVSGFVLSLSPERKKEY